MYKVRSLLLQKLVVDYKHIYLWGWGKIIHSVSDINLQEWLEVYVGMFLGDLVWHNGSFFL